jgi:hypothetical protein
LKNFNDFLEESLALQAKSEPKSAAASEARRMGLTYMGFGRYADRKGKLAYIVHDDRLVPYKSEDDIDDMYYKSYASGSKVSDKTETIRKEADFHQKVSIKRSTEDRKIIKQLNADVKAVDRQLFKFYKPGLFDSNEIDAIRNYTADGYQAVNRYLYKGHDDNATPEDDAYLANMINSLDSAFEETQAPFDYTVYSGLSSRYSANKFQVGGEYIFRGYVSTSLDFGTAIGLFSDVGETEQSIVLQIEIAKGQKSIYLDAISDNSGENETLLPRGSKIKVVSGPHVMDASLFTDAYDTKTIALFHCTLVQDV